MVSVQQDSHSDFLNLTFLYYKYYLLVFSRYETFVQFKVVRCRESVIQRNAVFSYIVMCRFSSFSSFSSTNGGGIPSRNIRSVSTSTRTVNGKTIVTKRFVDFALVRNIILLYIMSSVIMNERHFVLTSSSSNLLRSICITSSSYQFLPLFPTFGCFFECHILSFHQVAQHSAGAFFSYPL